MGVFVGFPSFLTVERVAVVRERPSGEDDADGGIAKLGEEGEE